MDAGSPAPVRSTLYATTTQRNTNENTYTLAPQELCIYMFTKPNSDPQKRSQTWGTKCASQQRGCAQSILVRQRASDQQRSFPTAHCRPLDFENYSQNTQILRIVTSTGNDATVVASTGDVATIVASASDVATQRIRNANIEPVYKHKESHNIELYRTPTQNEVRFALIVERILRPRNTDVSWSSCYSTPIRPR